MARRLLPALAVLVVVGAFIGGSVVVRHRSTAASAAVELPTSTPTSTSTDGAGGPIAFVATRPHPRVTADVVPTPPPSRPTSTPSGRMGRGCDGSRPTARRKTCSRSRPTIHPRVHGRTHSGRSGRSPPPEPMTFLCTRCVAISGGDQLAWSPNGDRLAARAPAGIVLIDPITFASRRPDLGGVVGVSSSPDGRSSRSRSRARGSRSSTSPRDAPDRTAPGSRGRAWSPDGERSCSRRSATARTSSTGRPLPTTPGRAEPGPAGARSTLGVYGLSWSPTAGRWRYCTSHPSPAADCSRSRGTVRRSGSIAVCGDTAAGDGSCPSGNVVAWSPDGDHLLVEDFTFGGAGPSLLVLTPGGTTTRVSGSLLPAWGLGWSPA